MWQREEAQGATGSVGRKRERRGSGGQSGKALSFPRTWFRYSARADEDPRAKPPLPLTKKHSSSVSPIIETGPRDTGLFSGCSVQASQFLNPVGICPGQGLGRKRLARLVPAFHPAAEHVITSRCEMANCLLRVSRFP
jgi:hypothetical protein